MENLAGEKVFNLIEIDRDLGNGSVEFFVENYATKEHAQEELRKQHQQVKWGLKQDGQELVIDDFGYSGNSLFSGTLKTISNSYEWKIQESNILLRATVDI